MGPGHAPTPPPQPQPHPYTHPVVGAAPYGPGAPAPAPDAPAPKRKGRAALVAIAAVVAFAVAGGATAYFLLNKEDAKQQRTGQAQGATSGAPSPSADGATTGQGEGEPAGEGTGTGADAGAGGGTPSQGTGGAPATPPQPADYKGIDLTEGYELGLADDPVKPKGDGGDIHYGISGLSTSDAGRLVLLRNGQEGTLQTCLDETRYTTLIEDSKMTKGSRICLQNGAGDVALLTVLGFAPESDPSDYISLDVTVWRGAMDVEQSS